MNTSSRQIKKFGNYFFNFLLVFLVGFVVISKSPTILNNFKLQSLKPEPVNILRLSGELISFPVLGEDKLVIFWMIECEPCKLEMKRIDELVSTGVLLGDQVIAINFVDNKEQVTNFIKEHPFQFLIALDTEGKVADQFKVNSTPTILFLDKKGGVEWATTGISPTLTLRAKRFFKKI